jgi:excisionase family DNA binding protein
MERTTESELLTSDEVIDLLLTRPDLRRLTHTCVLPAVRFGSEWRFRRRDLEEWIARQERPACAAQC